MFGPKHTVKSITNELVEGLDRGSIILHPEEPTDADVENFESMMKTTFARYRRRAVALMILSVFSRHCGHRNHLDAGTLLSGEPIAIGRLSHQMGSRVSLLHAWSDDGLCSRIHCGKAFG